MKIVLPPSFLNQGHKDIKPFHPVCRVAYKNRSHLFLYEPAYFQPTYVEDEKKHEDQKRVGF